MNETVSGAKPLTGAALKDPVGGVGGGGPPPLSTSCGGFDDAFRLFTIRLLVPVPFRPKVTRLDDGAGRQVDVDVDVRCRRGRRRDRVAGDPRLVVPVDGALHPRGVPDRVDALDLG